MSSFGGRVKGFFQGLGNKIKDTAQSFGSKIKSAAHKTKVAILGKEIIPPGAKFYAAFAKNAYNNPNDRPKDLNSYTYMPQYSGVTEAVYGNADKKKLILAVRGTQFTSPQDLLDDLKVVLGGESRIDRVPKNTELIRRLQTEYPGANIMLTGHSLGGSIILATLSKLQQAIPAYIFNPGYSHVKLFPNKYWKNVKNHHIVGDPISVMSRSIAGLNTMVFERQKSEPHGIDNFT